MRTSPEEYAQLLANQKRVDHKQVKLDHVPSIQEILALQLAERGVEIQTEYPFHPRRKYKADIYVPSHRLIVEVDGGGAQHGRHHRNQGYEDDRERDWLALMLGFTVLRVTTRQVLTNRAIDMVMQLLEQRGSAT